jgi:hypothetical protein
MAKETSNLTDKKNLEYWLDYTIVLKEPLTDKLKIAKFCSEIEKHFVDKLEQKKGPQDKFIFAFLWSVLEGNNSVFNIKGIPVIMDRKQTITGNRGNNAASGPIKIPPVGPPPPPIKPEIIAFFRNSRLIGLPKNSSQNFYTSSNMF